MAKKQVRTTNTMIRSALRRLFLRSREHTKCLKDAGYCCENCGVKQSRAKGKEVYIQIHHKKPVFWDGLFDEIRERLLHPAEEMRALCVDCHDEEERRLKIKERINAKP